MRAVILAILVASSAAQAEPLTGGSEVTLKSGITIKLPRGAEWQRETFDRMNYWVAGEFLQVPAPGNRDEYVLNVGSRFTGAPSCAGWQPPLEKAEDTTQGSWPKATRLVRDPGDSQDDENIAACYESPSGAFEVRAELEPGQESNAAALVTELVRAARQLKVSRVDGVFAPGAKVYLPGLDITITVPPGPSWHLRSDIKNGNAFAVPGDRKKLQLVIAPDREDRSCGDQLVAHTSLYDYLDRPAFWPARDATTGVFSLKHDVDPDFAMWVGCLTTRRGPLEAGLAHRDDAAVGGLDEGAAFLAAVIAGANASSGPFPRGSGDSALVPISGDVVLPVSGLALKLPAGTWFRRNEDKHDHLVLHGAGTAIEIEIDQRKDACPAPVGEARAAWPADAAPLVERASTGVELARGCLGGARPVDVTVKSLAIASADAARLRTLLVALAQAAR